jgi:lipopolysaccharide export system protein LptA
LAAVMVLMGLTLWLLRGSEELPPEFRATPYEQEVARELRRFRVSLRDAKGRLLWELFGERVLVKKNGDYLLEGVKEGYYYHNGERWLRVQAERATYQAATRNVTVEGRVQVESLKEEIRFEADRVEWRERDRLLRCPQVKTLVYRDYILRTGRLLYHVDRRELECPDPLTAEGKGDQLEAMRLTANLKENTWRLFGPGRFVHWVVLGTTLALLPRPTEGQPAAPEKGQRRKVRVELHYEKLVHWDQEKGLGLVEGVVLTVPEDEVTVYADRLEYDEKKDLARATGHLRLVDPENILTGKRILVYLKEGRAVIEGEVRLVHTPKEVQKAAAEGSPEVAPATPEEAAQPPPEEGREKERIRKYREEVSILSCDRLEYFYRRPRKAVATGHIRLEQPRVGRFATAEQAFYFEETDTLRLVGNVRLQDEEGQSFTGPEIEIGVEKEWVRAKGPGHIVLYVEEEETEETPPPPSGEGEGQESEQPSGSEE